VLILCQYIGSLFEILNGKEFIMSSTDKDILLKIRKLAFQIDWEDAFGGKSKGNQHLFRITEIAKFLAREVCANLFVVEAGALLHDTSLSSGDDSDYMHNKQIIIELLKQFDLTDNQSSNIAECVASHEGTTKPKTLEAKVVHDADVLEKSGILGIIRHTWKLTNLEMIQSDKIDDVVVNKILEHLRWRGEQLCTPIAIRMHKYLMSNIDVSHAKLIIYKIAQQAQEGFITEQIADSLMMTLSKERGSTLKKQLNLKYLLDFL